MNDEQNSEQSETSQQRDEAPTVSHTTQKSGEDNPPPLYISGFGVMGQAVPDVATGSTPVTRPDD